MHKVAESRSCASPSFIWSESYFYVIEIVKGKSYSTMPAKKASSLYARTKSFLACIVYFSVKIIETVSQLNGSNSMKFINIRGTQ